MTAPPETKSLILFKKAEGGIFVKEILSLFQRIGIDKLELSNLTVVAIDFDRLRQTKAKISLFPAGSRAVRYDNQDMPIKQIVMRDNCVFNDFTIGCAGSGNYVHEYVYLALTVACARGNNVRNMSWREYDYYLGYVCKYIADAYGVLLDASKAKIKGIELNCNIFLSYPYSHYHRVLTLLAALSPKTLKFVGTYGATSNHYNKDGAENSDSFLLRNQQIEIIFYDKRDQNKGQAKQEDAGKNTNSKSKGLLRVELRLCTAEKIKAAFGTNDWAELDDNVMVNWYYRTLTKWYITREDKWEKQCIILLRKMLQTAKNETPKNWHHLLMHRLKDEEIRTQTPIILDIEQVILAIRQLNKPNYTRSHMVKVIQRAKCSELDVFWQNDLDKIHEILSGFQRAYKATQHYAGVDTSNML